VGSLLKIKEVGSIKQCVDLQKCYQKWI